MFNPQTDRFDPSRLGFVSPQRGNRNIKTHGEGPNKWRAGYVSGKLHIWKPRNELLYDGAPMTHCGVVCMLYANGWNGDPERDPFDHGQIPFKFWYGVNRPGRY